MQPKLVSLASSEQARVLTTSVLKAAALLNIAFGDLGRMLGLSAATISRMNKGDYTLVETRKEWDLALLFVRMFRSLDSLVAGREASAQAWLHSHNEALGAVPAEMIKTVVGLVHVTDYLDAVRGRV